MITEKAMIVTMIMDTVEEITTEGSNNDQQRGRPDESGRLFLFICIQTYCVTGF